jgi:hypothetical protein
MLGMDAFSTPEQQLPAMLQAPHAKQDIHIPMAAKTGQADVQVSL